MLAILGILGAILGGLGILVVAGITALFVSGCSDSEDEKAKAPESQKSDSSDKGTYVGPVLNPYQNINCMGDPKEMSLSFPALGTDLLRTTARLKEVPDGYVNRFFSINNDPIDDPDSLGRTDFSRVCPAVNFPGDENTFDFDEIDSTFTVRSSDKQINYSIQAFVGREDWDPSWIDGQKELYNALKDMGVQNMRPDAAVPLGLAYGPVVFDIAKHSKDNKILKEYLAEIRNHIANSNNTESILMNVTAFAPIKKAAWVQETVKSELSKVADDWIKPFIEVFIDGGVPFNKAHAMYIQLTKLHEAGKELPEKAVEEFEKQLKEVAKTIGIPSSLDENELRANTLETKFGEETIKSTIEYNGLSDMPQKDVLYEMRKEAYKMMLFFDSLRTPKATPRPRYVQPRPAKPKPKPKGGIIDPSTLD